MYKCKECSFELWNQVTKLKYSTLGLYDDARFPGRCILSFDNHYDHLTDMSLDDYHDFMDEIYQASSHLKKALQCKRINVAILGNTESHVHAHLIPRYGVDPVPNKSPWNHPDNARPMSVELKESVINAIKKEFL